MTTFPTLILGVAACLAAVIAVSGAPATVAGDIEFQSRAGTHASLVELYTSEGCSSCPPAETWLSRLTTNPKLWSEIVPVAFHVDYWDSPGWRDRFASRVWTTRQRDYAARWGASTVYTPGFVLDGREWQDWSSYDNGLLPSSASNEKTESAGQLDVTVKNGKTVTVIYRAVDGRATTREVSAVLLGCDLSSNVKAGENTGRSLRHDFVALAFEKKKLTGNGPEQSISFELPSPSTEAKRLALAVWVEEPGQAGIQQATGGWLNK